MKESEVVAEYARRLEPGFHVHHEVEGKSIISGINKRIDMVIVSRDVPPKRTQKIAFGIEFKADQMESMNDYTSWLRQAIGYTQCVWGPNSVRLPILVAPFINREYCDQIGQEQSFIMSRLAGQFGIGELGVIKYKADYGKGDSEIRIKISDTRLWSDVDGWNQSLVGMNFQKRYTL
jgi:hypothetical protein